MAKIYFNSNEFTPLSEEVKTAMKSAVDNFADTNPIGFGNDYSAEAEVAETKSLISERLNAGSYHFSFTNGSFQSGIELINLSVLVMDVQLVVTSVFENNAKLNYIRKLEEAGKIQLHLLKTTDFGEIDLDDLKNVLKNNKSKALISLSHANSFTGVLLPVKDITVIAKQYNAFFHLDSSLMIGKYDIDLSRFGVDFLSFDVSLINGPLGIGCLFVNESLKISNKQFNQLKSALKAVGNKNVVLIAGLKVALLKALDSINKWQKKMGAIRSYFVTELENKLQLKTSDHFLKKGGLFNQLAFFAPEDKFGKYLVEKLDLKGFVVSKKCYPLQFNHFSEHHFVNISFSIDSTKQEIDAFLNFMQNTSRS